MKPFNQLHILNYCAHLNELLDVKTPNQPVIPNPVDLSFDVDILKKNIEQLETNVGSNSFNNAKETLSKMMFNLSKIVLSFGLGEEFEQICKNTYEASKKTINNTSNISC